MLMPLLPSVAGEFLLSPEACFGQACFPRQGAGSHNPTNEKPENMNAVKRLALYVFSDKDGYVGDYVKYYVRALKEVTDRVVFIVNGQILPEGKKEIEDTGAEVLIRENKGFDFGAWKEAILKIGFTALAGYDELILCDCSSYGPVYPLSEVFSEMGKRDCGFWGITKHPATGKLLVRGDKSSAVVEHIQTYFIVFSRKVIESDSFQKWWNDLEPSSNFQTETALHENRLTQYLHESGFSYDTYVDCDKYFERLSFDHPYIRNTVSYNPNNATYSPDGEVFKTDRDPFVRRNFFLNEAHIWSNTGAGYTPLDVMGILKQTSYPVGLIFADLLRKQRMSAIKDGLALTWVHKKAVSHSKRKLALVCYAYYADLAEYMCPYLLNMPDGSDLYIISSKQEVLDAYKKVLTADENAGIFSEIHYLLKPNRGRDVASLVVTFAPYVKKYEAFCFIHDKKSKQLLYTLAHDFLRRCLECCLYSKSYVSDLVEALFDDSERCGAMVPPVPYFSLYGTIGAEAFGKTAELLKSLCDRLHLNVPFDEHPIAAFGTMFWARTDALTDLFSCQWNYDDFPEEPLAVDFTISHALERVICFCAQNRGYVSNWAMPESFAELYINNLSYRLRDFNIELNRILKVHSWHDQLNILKTLPSAGSPSAITAKAGANAAAEQAFSCWSYLLYKALSKITFGRRREHYRKKYKALKSIKRERRIRFF